MLVLTRKEAESLYIDNIRVTIVAIEKDKVRIGIDAPKSMRIFREELLTETSTENYNAARSFFASAETVGEKKALEKRLYPLLSALGKNKDEKD